MKGGADHEAVVVGPQSLLSALDIAIDEGTLTASVRSGFRGGGRLTLRATAPTLAALRFAGASDASIAGIDSESLAIELLGASELRVEDSTIGALTLRSQGAADIDLSGALVTDAHLDMSGASDLTLTMNGGVLAGRVSGAGDVTYGGSVSSVELTTSPAVDLRRRDPH